MSKNKGSKANTDYMNEFNSGTDEEFEQSLDQPEEDFGSLLSESFKNQSKHLKVGDKIRGKILNLGSEEVFVTTGTRHEGIVQRKEFFDEEGKALFQVGDTVDLFVTLVKGSEIRLSRNPTDRNLAEDLKQAFDQDRPIQGRVVEVCKGGVRVNIKGKLAFCPISQLDSARVESGEEFIGRSLEFKITEFSEGGRNIVVSRRKLLDVERETGMTSFLADTQDGTVVTGKVTRLETFGAFVELAPGVEGLVHISEIAWSRIGAPSEVLAPGQTVQVKLLKREVLNGRAKISLSIKQVTPREMPAKEEKSESLAPKVTLGQLFDGKITRKEPYGVFVQLEPGMNGLLHKSRIGDSKEIQFEKLRVNDTIRVQVVEVKGAERQISLGIPGVEGEEDWRLDYKSDSSASLGTLGSKFASALQKKK